MAALLGLVRASAGTHQGGCVVATTAQTAYVSMWVGVGLIALASGAAATSALYTDWNGYAEQ